MILYFQHTNKTTHYLIQTVQDLTKTDLQKLTWLFSDAIHINQSTLQGTYVGPRREIITPWGTNAVEITQNMGIEGIQRIEQFEKTDNPKPSYDPMLQTIYKNLTQSTLTIDKQPDSIQHITNIEKYNREQGLALSPDEIRYLQNLSKKLKRPLTDSEIFGFSQVNSEHCRHKIFNGTYIVDGKEQPKTLFQHIKETSKQNPNKITSAYKDNVAFVEGGEAIQFAPVTQHQPDYFQEIPIKTILSLKAETHNFPTTVEPFNGAATGTGGEIRDRLAGGRGSVPIAGTAVYMTSYPRLTDDKPHERNVKPREWLYQTPQQILTKASNGASDFGNKFGQPLICGSTLTFEHNENGKQYGYDKTIMLAGGIGYAKKQHNEKQKVKADEKVVLLGGDNYRIGMGGGAVSSVATGEYENKIELNAVQRSNPEMQKRAANVIRALTECEENPIVSIHDHGAGGHLNCLSELVEETGGQFQLDRFPIGDPTLSDKEIVGNESQERMGLVVKKEDIKMVEKIAQRERSPIYEVGVATNDKQLTFQNTEGDSPIDLQISDLLGNPPKTIIQDTTTKQVFEEVNYYVDKLQTYVEQLLQIEAVACKDWLTNKVDRSVTGRVALQQTTGKLQLPLNNLGVVTTDYKGVGGMATSIGHAPVPALISAEAGSVLSIAEALTNIVWTPIEDGIKGISLSANWMWACKNEGEDARLYRAVEAASQFAIELGINIPTGKDSLSMTQKYPNGDIVLSAGTVIISAIGKVTDIKKTISPTLKNETSTLMYVDFSSSKFEIGGSSFAQTQNKIGKSAPTIKNPKYFARAFDTIQQLLQKRLILAGHDVSAGGLVATLLEMTFADDRVGMKVDLNSLQEDDLIKVLFAENPAIVIQVKNIEEVVNIFEKQDIHYHIIGKPTQERTVKIIHSQQNVTLEVDKLRDLWFKTSYLLDDKQVANDLAKERFNNYKSQPLKFDFDATFTGKLSQYKLPINDKSNAPRAAIIREKGVNGDREMAYAMYLAGFNVKDVHMTDLIAGRETLEDVSFIVFVGGFSNSDVLGSAKGWAGAFKYNPKAEKALRNFYKRKDTLSLGVCNGCQLMVELNLIHPETHKVKMEHNNSHKFESAFLNVDIPQNNSVMLHSLAGTRLGVWIAHGEGKFDMCETENQYHIAMKYSFDEYPANPNGSSYNTAAISSPDGRHLAMMPHIERSIFPWQWAHYPEGRVREEITPWIEAFVNARKWVEKND